MRRWAQEALALQDIQGLVARGYGGLPVASYLLLAVRDRTAAGAALGRWAETVTAAQRTPKDVALNLGFTAAGLEQLTGWTALPDGFSEAFRFGMVDDHRSRLLGDVGDSDPSRWTWGGPATPQVHVLAAVFAQDPETLTARVAELAAEAAFTVVAQLDATPLAVNEAFGFHDGISQPLIAGLGHAAGDTVASGEFVLGYPNEYGQRTQRPLLARSADPGRLLPLDPEGSGSPDLGLNATYLVFRQIAQDVEAFHRYVAEETAVDGVVDPVARDRYAARIVGRWPSGAPLVLAPDADDPALASANDFAYHHEDPLGMACPIGSHVRRVNPRDSLAPSPGTKASTKINHRHRLVRRGRNYSQPDEQGLFFQCINANIARQFEFVQHTWLQDPSFHTLHDSPDPLVGGRPAGRSNFVEQAVPVRRRHVDLPAFTRLRGGAYFFLPGIAGLRFLAHVAANPPGGPQ